MRTRSVILIGIIVLFVIFGVSSFLQWQCAQEIKKVSEYHRSMSIPAITILEQVKLSFQEMHIASIKLVESDLIIKHEEEHHSYQNGKDTILDYLEKYDTLANVKNSQGELVAPEMMQVQMQNYIQIYHEIINDNDAVIEQFQSGEFATNDAIAQLTSIEIDFHKTMEKNSKMEIAGIEENEEKIIEIEKKMGTIFFSTGIIAISSTVMIVIFTTQFVSIPLSRLVRVTNKIGKEGTINIDKNSRNSDVSDVLIALNEMSEDLEKYREKMINQEKMSIIGELSSRFAHDIRNPLTVIKVTMDIMRTKNKNLTEDEIKKFERIDDAMYRITHQIDNVLDFVKGKPLKLTRQSIRKILDSVMDDLPKNKNITLDKTSADTEIECDFETMKIVLINLIINAMQAIENEGKITIKSETKDDQAIIEVSDSGPGIPEEKIGKIFEPIFTTKQEGTGLGLASCKSIIEQHGGKISVKNNPTRFIIKIPQKTK